MLLVNLQNRREREKESFDLQDFLLLNTKACIILLFNKTPNFSQMTIVIRLRFSDMKPDLLKGDIAVLSIDRFEHEK